MAVNPVPENYHSVTPYLSIKGATEALEFYKLAFNATEIFRLPTPNGKIGHADILIGDSHIMLSTRVKKVQFQVLKYWEVHQLAYMSISKMLMHYLNKLSKQVRKKLSQ